MSHFIIDGFDFGLDTRRSSVGIDDSRLQLKVVGDDSVIAKIARDERHPWSWLLQPPFLYVTGVPCVVGTNGNFEHVITEQELDDYDIALYVAEHCDVSPCRIKKTGKVVTVDGKVHRIRKTPLDFNIQYEMA